MRLEYESAGVANRAMASVLLLYYHLLREDGFTNDQTVYVNADDFDSFTFLDVEVSEELAPDVDQTLLREGAVIYLLCDLYDLVGEYEDNYLQFPFTERVRSARAAGHLAAIPEAEEIVDMISAGESLLDYKELAKRLAQVYERYVRARFLALATGIPSAP